VLSNEPIDFYIEFINELIEVKLLNKSERILKSTLSNVKGDSLEENIYEMKSLEDKIKSNINIFGESKKIEIR